MVSSEFRLEARKKLDGKWGKVACFSLAYLAVIFVIELIVAFFPESMQSILSLIVSIIDVPISFGFIFSLFKLYNDEEVSAFDFLSLGFSNFKKSWGISFQIFLKMLLPALVIFVSYVLIGFGVFGTAGSVLYNSSAATSFSAISLIGFILLIASMIWAITKSYYYQLAYIVACDNPEMTYKEAVSKSEELMTNKRGKLFALQLSFIGWNILCCFTLGIGFLWLVPYFQFAIIAFYIFVSDNNSKVKSETLEEDTNNPIQ